MFNSRFMFNSRSTKTTDTRHSSSAAMLYKFVCACIGLITVALSTSVFAFNTSTTYSGVLVGPDNPPPAGTNVYAPDLGFSTVYLSYGVIAFGDTYDDAQGNSDELNDDAMAYFSMAGTSAGTVPTLNWLGNKQHVRRNGVPMTDPGLSMGGANTPTGVTDFGGSVGWYGMFLRGSSYAECTNDAECNGLTCDKSMGYKAQLPLPIPGMPAPPVAVCWKVASGWRFEVCNNVNNDLNAGLCRDSTSSLAEYNNGNLDGRFIPGGFIHDTVDNTQRTAQGKILSVAKVQEFGRVKESATDYRTVPYVTNKFVNVTMKSSTTYTDYSRATNDNASNVLWIWGRPNFWHNENSNAIGIEVRDANNELYLAANYRSNLPDPANVANDSLDLFYRTATGGWNTDQKEAAPIEAVDGWADGVSGHISVTYLEGPEQWVMLYGGGTPTFWDFVFGQGLASSLANNAEGSIKMRTSPDPWGPWSEPEVVLGPNDWQVCAQLWGGCDWTEQGMNFNFPFQTLQPGVLYGAQIFEGWNQSTPNSAEIGWFVSTWNPYQVLQMKTIIDF